MGVNKGILPDSSIGHTRRGKVNDDLYHPGDTFSCSCDRRVAWKCTVLYNRHHPPVDFMADFAVLIFVLCDR